MAERLRAPVHSAVVLGGGATATSVLLALADRGCTSARLLVRDPARAAGDASRPAGGHPTRRRSRSAASRTPNSTRDGSPPTSSSRPSRPHAQTAQVVAACAAVPAVFEVVYDPWPTPLAQAALDSGRHLVSRGRPARPPGGAAGAGDDRSRRSRRPAARGGARRAGAPVCGERRIGAVRLLTCGAWTPRTCSQPSSAALRARRWGWFVPTLIARVPEPEPDEDEPAAEPVDVGGPASSSPASCLPRLPRSSTPTSRPAAGWPCGASWPAAVAGVGASARPWAGRAPWSTCCPFVPFGVALFVIDWRTTLLPSWLVKPAYPALVVLILLAWPARPRPVRPEAGRAGAGSWSAAGSWCSG